MGRATAWSQWRRRFGDLALVLAAAKSVDLDAYFLALAHVLQLGLLVVGRDPEVVERDDGHKVLTHADVAANGDVFLVDDAGDGRDDLGVAEVQLGLLQLGPVLLDVGTGSFGAGLLHLKLLGAVLLRLLRVGTGGGEARLCLAHLSLLTDDVLLRLKQGGVGGCGCRNSLVKLLLADDVLGDKGGVAVNVELSLESVCLLLIDASLGSSHSLHGL